MTLRVGAPEQTASRGRKILQARIGCAALPEGSPGALQYSMAEDNGLEFTTLADPFLCAALPVAMKLGEPLEIAGTTSARLALGAATYQDILVTWWPETFQRVPVAFEHRATRRREPRPAGVGCCFSGGIDSFNAVQELRPPLNPFPEHQITHALMINGFDQVVDLEHTGIARQMHDVYKQALAQWDVELVMVHANLKLLRERVFDRDELVHSFGSPLTACAHALAPIFGRFNLSGHATYRHKDLKPMGSHPALDHHLSSDHLEIRHLGARLARSEKLESMVDQAPVRESLRVCFRRPEFDARSGAPVNCGTCEKCIRTIVMLDILGRLEDFPTFAKRAAWEAYRQPRLLAHIPPMFLDDLIHLAERHDHGEWLALLKQAQGLQS